MNSLITLIIGLPNAGKTTFSERYADVIHYDDLRNLKQDERTPIYAAADVIEGIYNSAESRKRILSAWRDRKERRVVIWLDTPVLVCLERERRHRMRPDSLVLYHAKSFEPPTLDEGWDEIQIIRWQPDNEPTVTFLYKEVPNVDNNETNYTR